MFFIFYFDFDTFKIRKFDLKKAGFPFGSEKFQDLCFSFLCMPIHCLCTTHIQNPQSLLSVLIIRKIIMCTIVQHICEEFFSDCLVNFQIKLPHTVMN